jgi:hypothetical protein
VEKTDRGMKERLVAIRNAIDASKERAEELVPTSLELEKRALVNEGSSSSPWRTIWLHPRATIRHVVDSHHSAWWYISLIVIGAGVGRGLNRAVATGAGDRFSLLGVFGASVAFGAMMSLLTLHLGGAILAACLRLMGGWGARRDIRLAIAWGSAPQLVSLFVWVPVITLVGHDLFKSGTSASVNQIWIRWLLFALFVSDFIFVVWSVVLVVRCVAEVSQLAPWRVLAASMLSFGLVFAGASTTLAIAPPWLVTRRLSPEPAGARVAPKIPELANPASPKRRVNRHPPAELGPAVSAIWEEGCEVKATVDPRRPARPIVEIEIGSDFPTVTTDVLRHLRNLPELKRLILTDGRPYSDASFRHLRGLEQLEEFAAANVENISDFGIENLGSKPSLRTLRLYSCPQITGSGLGSLVEAKALRTLVLYRCSITSEGMQSIGDLTSLQALTLFLNPVDDASLAPLSRLKELKKLELMSLPIQGAGLRQLRELSTLEELDLFGSTVTDEAIEHISKLKSLRVLNLQKTSFSREGIRRLRSILPRCRIKG